MFLNIFYSCFAELEQTFNVDLVHDLGAVIVSVEYVYKLSVDTALNVNEKLLARSV